MLYHKTYINHESPEWVVFIHGAGGSSAVWYKQVQAYYRHFNLLLIDLRGHGRSETGPAMNRHDYSFDSIALDVVEVLDHLAITKAHFVGVSLGTIIIRKLAQIKSTYIKSMILVGAITHLSIKSRFLIKLARMFHFAMPPMWLYKLFAFVIMPFDDSGESRNVFVREARRMARKEFLRWFMLTRRLTDKIKKMEETDPQIPTLYVMGEYDFLFLEPIRQRVRRFKHNTLEVVEKCGHVVNIEQSAIFNELSIQYIRHFSSAQKTIQAP